MQLPELEFEHLDPEYQVQVDELCDEFESALRSGETVRIEDFLSRMDHKSSRRTIVKELIGLELFHTRSNREALTCAAYRARFSGYQDSVFAAFRDAGTLFSSGTIFGPFRIERRIGEGGMGIVYEAHDEKLERNVALKILPFAFALDKSRLAQFQQEAKILAGLSHPHIATLYGFEEVAGLHFCVMEYVPGATLDNVLHDTEKLTLDDATRLFKQLGSALEYAHSRGIVHRDLKPSNIAITPAGDAKLLDFGLALNVQEARGVDQRDSNPTTAVGLLAGTIAYMSPEQVCGREIDKRSDIWAFGCCLYEAVSGHRAFRRETTDEVATAIVNAEPNWTKLPTNTPKSMRFLLSRCLQKDPVHRLRDVGDAWFDDDYLDHVLTEQVNQPSPRKVYRLALNWGPPCLVGVLITSFALFFGSLDVPRTQTHTRWVPMSLPDSTPIALADRAQLAEGRPAIALTPDGTQLIFVTLSDDVAKLCVLRFDRPYNSHHVRVLEGTDGAFNPFVSPDGKWVGFLTSTSLMKVSLTGGKPIKLCDVSHSYGASWGTNGQVYFSEDLGRRLCVVSEQTGKKEVIAEKSLANRYIWPEVLPNGMGVLVYQEHRGIVAVSRSGEERLVHSEGTHARYIPGSEHLVFATRGRLFATPFDLDRMQTTGDAVRVVDDVRTESRGAAQFCTSEHGTLIYIRGEDASISELVQVPVHPTGDVEKEEVLLGFPPGIYGTFELSPSGHELAVVVWNDEKRNIWIFDLERKTRMQMTFVGDNRTPLWTPDGNTIIFSSDQSGPLNLYQVAVNEPGNVQRLTTSAKNHFASHFFQDGGRTWLAFTARSFPEESKEWMLSLDTHEIRSLPEAHKAGQLHMLSPDGEWIAYGEDQVWIERYAGSGPKSQVSIDGGEEAVWAPTGDFIYYRNGRDWMSVAVQTEPNLSLGDPQRLFESGYLNVRDRSFDITRDGKHFLLLRGPDASGCYLILNWFDELKRLARNVN